MNIFTLPIENTEATYATALSGRDLNS